MASIIYWPKSVYKRFKIHHTTTNSKIKITHDNVFFLFDRHDLFLLIVNAKFEITIILAYFLFFLRDLFLFIH